MSAIVLVDTSVLLNILDVPGKNQNREDIFEEFKKIILKGDHLLLPMTAIIETGRHIAHLSNGGLRRQYAQIFVDQIKQALEGTAPWQPINFLKQETVLSWLEDFPDQAQRGLSLTDLSIIKEWEKLCEIHRLRRVRIWTLDSHLGGYDLGPRRRIMR